MLEWIVENYLTHIDEDNVGKVKERSRPQETHCKKKPQPRNPTKRHAGHVGPIEEKKRIENQLLAATQTQHQVESGLFLDVIIRESTSVLQLLTSKDKTLLVRRNTLLVLDLALDVVDGV